MFEAPTHRCFSHEILKGDESWINELPRSQARSSRQYAKFCWTSASRKPNTARVSTISPRRSEEHTSEPVTNAHLVCRLLLETKNTRPTPAHHIPTTPHQHSTNTHQPRHTTHPHTTQPKPTND